MLTSGWALMRGLLLIILLAALAAYYVRLRAANHNADAKALETANGELSKANAEFDKLQAALKNAESDVTAAPKAINDAHTALMNAQASYATISADPTKSPDEVAAADKAVQAADKALKEAQAKPAKAMTAATKAKKVLAKAADAVRKAEAAIEALEVPRYYQWARLVRIVAPIVLAAILGLSLTTMKSANGLSLGVGALYLIAASVAAVASGGTSIASRRIPLYARCAALVICIASFLLIVAILANSIADRSMLYASWLSTVAAPAALFFGGLANFCLFWVLLPGSAIFWLISSFSQRRKKNAAAKKAKADAAKAKLKAEEARKKQLDAARKP